MLYYHIYTCYLKEKIYFPWPFGPVREVNNLSMSFTSIKEEASVTSIVKIKIADSFAWSLICS